MSVDFEHKQLVSLVGAHLPSLQAEPTFMPITTGKFNFSYWVQAGEKELVLRIAPPRDAVFVFYEQDMMRQEPAIHALLLRETDVPVAPILAFDDSLQLIDRDFMIMERLPGRPLTEMGHVEYGHVLRQVGGYLRQVHGLQAEAYGYLGAHKPMDPQANWVDAFGVMWHKIIDDIKSVGYYDGEEAAHMRGLLDRHLHHFDRPIEASLLHMDIWHQNILVDAQGTVTGLVDWDRGLWGDPEIEFAVLDYCGISEAPFWEGYGQPRDESTAANIRQLFYLLYEVQKYIVIRHGRNHDPQGAAQYKTQVLGMAERLR